MGVAGLSASSVSCQDLHRAVKYYNACTQHCHQSNKIITFLNGKKKLTTGAGLGFDEREGLQLAWARVGGGVGVSETSCKGNF